jgi:hypothetical protein
MKLRKVNPYIQLSVWIAYAINGVKPIHQHPPKLGFSEFLVTIQSEVIKLSNRKTIEILLNRCNDWYTSLPKRKHGSSYQLRIYLNSRIIDSRIF